MRTLITLALVLTAACAYFVGRGLPALSALEQADRRLVERTAETERIAAELDLVSEPELERLRDEATELAERNRRWAANLVDASLWPERPDLDAALEATSLEPIRELAQELRAQGAVSPQASRALALLVEELGRHEIVQIGTLELVGNGRLQPIPGVEGMAAIEARIALVADLPAVLDVLEALVPGRGAPVVSIRQASVNRMSLDRWNFGGQSLAGPPARLSVTVSLAFALDRGGRG